MLLITQMAFYEIGKGPYLGQDRMQSSHSHWGESEVANTDTVLRGLPFVSKYIDDILIHSPSEEEHLCHLQLVFERLKQAGLTLRGRKCHIGVPYLGHTFSKLGMAPEISQALLNPSNSRPPNTAIWQQPQMRRYRQLWSQLVLQNGIVYRKYTPGPTHGTVTVPLLP